MDMQDRLDALRSTAEQSDLAAYTDIGAGLVLSWSSPAPCPREALDSLAARATACFALAGAISPGHPPAAALHFTARRTEAFGRPDAEGDEAICLAAPAESDAAMLLSCVITDPQNTGEQI
ncbi:hypothetical protein [Roseobacter ponti]|uniref:Roadblock/LAMTOR2 domain-containing protein n=1 Tax=Roseobacter ponti TaxID=1891787 RepID=A0A858SQN2_9RHOB|nr:hypothetical protein [Roseobacter ponti]QJF51159.1 hypothetical protein G3256_08295 [Roseobacter ponti]